MPRTGWTDAGLPSVGQDPALWTVTDAAGLLGPPQLTVAQVRQLVTIAGVAPVGKRRVSTTGRQARVYPSLALITAYDRLYSLHTQTAAP